MTTIDSFHLSDPGQKRANNEDAAGAHEPQDARQLKQSGRLYVVADGLGGHQMGEKASALAVETLLKVYYKAPEIPPEKRLRDIIQQVNQDLIAYARKNLAPGEKTATTVVAAVVRNDTLLVANVGDSRAYLIRDGKIRQITNDHSFVGEMVRAGTMTEVEAQQSKYKNRLTRSVGGSEANLEVEVYPPIPLRTGDILLLCTDGLTQYATGQNLLAGASNGSARQIVERLIRFANAHGGSDNITASVIKFGRKSFFPAAKPVKVLATVGLGVLMLAVFSLLAWYWLTGQPPFLRATATPTASPTMTVTLTPTLTPTPPATLTPKPTQTALPTPSNTLTPEPSVSPAPSGTIQPQPRIAP
jgi:protein phosphatase